MESLESSHEANPYTFSRQTSDVTTWLQAMQFFA